MSQYDQIGSRYKVFKTLPNALVEKDNIHDALKDRIKGARVLGLACGLGFYSHKLLEWGASYVLGIDLSPAMVKTATESISGLAEAETRLEFRTGNALTLGKIEDKEPFDIVIGIWLVNYAASSEEAKKMFESISANLKPGGRFVGILPHPAEDLDGFAAMSNEFEEVEPAKWGPSVIYYERLESGEGWRTEVIVRSEGEQEVKFRNFHLHHSIYEQAAKTGGMGGKIEWPRIQIPDHAVQELGESFWELYYEKGPSLGLLIAEK